MQKCWQIPEQVRELLFLVLIFFGSIVPAFPQSTIKIGFLIRDKRDIAIQQTAQLAIQEANAQGGYKGQKFELVTRSCDGPWGMTSKQAVALIYEDQVPILVTALDGRNAHLAEQVTAKSHVVMLSTLSSDPTLSKAYVPWYFRMVPDDEQQAEVLVDQIYQKDGAKEVAVISLDDYDGRMSSEAFVRVSKEMGYPGPEVFMNLGQNELFERLKTTAWDAIVLAGSSEDLSEIRELFKNIKIYSFLNTFNFLEEYPGEGKIPFDFSTSDDTDLLKLKNFLKQFRIDYNKIPTMTNAYVYDGILLATKAILRYGTDAEAIRKGFKELRYDGITGKVEFGKLGNRELKLLIE